MSNIARYDPIPNPNPITEYLISVDTPNYQNQPNILINPDVSQVEAFPLRYWKHVAGSIQLMTVPEQNSVDAAIAAAEIAAAKLSAKNFLDLFTYQARLIRAIVKLIVDQFNVMRSRDRDRAADVAAATNLADLKTRWAARSALNDITYQQAKTAIDNLVDGE